MSLLQNPFTAQSGASVSQAQPGDQSMQGGTPGNIPAKTGQNNQSLTVPGEDIDPVTGKPKVAASNDPLSNFDKLWDPELDSSGKPIQIPADESYLPKLDAAQLQQMLEKLDFTKGIKPEQIEAIKAGGDDGVKTMLQVVNQANRQSMAVMFNAFTKMTESGLSTAKGKFLQAVPSHVKGVMIDDSLTSDNPIASNPAFAPMVDAIKTQFQTKYPKATPSQIKTAVDNYFNKLHADMQASIDSKDPNKKKVDPKTAIATGSPAADWESWFDDSTTPAQT